jgi:hypothetical protein
MNTDKLVATLQQIRALLDEALKDVGAPAPRHKRSKTRTQVVKEPPRNALPMHILKLRDARFFNPPKTYMETHAKLQPIYACEPNRVAVALVRLNDRKQLRKTSKRVGKKKLIAYGW